MPKIIKFAQEYYAQEEKPEGADKACTLLPPPQRAPWLVFFSHGKHQKLQTFVSLSEEKVYVRELDEMSQSDCYGCCAGWLFMIDASYSCCSLLNLLSMKRIMLPPLPEDSELPRNFIMTSSLLTQGSAMILGYRSDKNDFIFHRIQEDSWELVKCNCEEGLGSLVKCKDTIYALTNSSQLAVVNVVPCPKVRLLGVDFPAAWGIMYRNELVESCGELFLLSQIFVFRVLKLHSFEVYRMDFSKMRWVEVNSIGDRAFFMGVFWRFSISCSASEAGIAGNCIYFIGESDFSGILKYDMADHSVSKEMSWPGVPEPWTEVAWINIAES